MCLPRLASSWDATQLELLPKVSASHRVIRNDLKYFTELLQNMYCTILYYYVKCYCVLCKLLQYIYCMTMPWYGTMVCHLHSHTFCDVYIFKPSILTSAVSTSAVLPFCFFALETRPLQLSIKTYTPLPLIIIHN